MKYFSLVLIDIQGIKSFKFHVAWINHIFEIIVSTVPYLRLLS
jgi:hypothetical protein